MRRGKWIVENKERFGNGIVYKTRLEYTNQKYWTYRGTDFSTQANTYNKLMKRISERIDSL